MKNFSAPPKFRLVVSRVLLSVPLFGGGLLFGLAAIGVTPVQVANGQSAQQNESLASAVISEPHFATGPIYTQVPLLTPEQLKMREEELKEVNKLPPLPGERRNTDPTDAPTAPQDDTYLLPLRSAKSPNAPSDFIYKRVHDLPSSEASSSQSVINESSVGNMGDTVFFTGNWYAARSGNGGQTFTYVNPSTTFPSVNNGFCCDQVANYAPNQNMMIWALQYSKDTTSGTLRIARAVGSASVLSNSWIYYDFNPQGLGFASGNWMDFPNVTLADNYLFVTSNVYATDGDGFSGAVIIRISLAELAAGGTLHSNSFKITDANSLRCSEGAHTTMYCGTHISTTQVRIYRWDDSSGTVAWDNVAINSFNPLSRDGVAMSPDGTNWAARADDRVLGSWVANGVIGLMWGARQGGSFPFPYTVIARFNASNRSLLSQNNLWSDQVAWLYPTASVNANGNLAGLVSFGGGTYYPGANLWISDDIENGFSPLALHGATTSGQGPSSNAWGDYATVHPHKDYKNTWVASTHYIDGTTGNVVPRYLWVGRERDFSVSVKSDFNGDGRSDLVWQNASTGQAVLWFMDGQGNEQSGKNIQNGASFPGSNLMGAGDLNSDGKCDLMWQNTSNGQVYIWFMDGQGNQQSGRYIQGGATFPGWNVIPAGDLNGDGKSDIMWQNASNGQVYVWFMDGQGNQQSGRYLQGGATFPGWRVAAAGDLNGDGKSDIMWQNTSNGQVYVWFMDGQGNQQSGRYLQGGATFPGWNVIAGGDLNSDGKSDLIWQNTSSGQGYIWFMDGQGNQQSGRYIQGGANFGEWKIKP